MDRQRKRSPWLLQNRAVEKDVGSYLKLAKMLCQHQIDVWILETAVEKGIPVRADRQTLINGTIQHDEHSFLGYRRVEEVKFKLGLFRLLADIVDPGFERVYDDRFAEKHGFWRPVVRTVGDRSLDCGDLGFYKRWR
jgi:hypothetical protein